MVRFTSKELYRQLTDTILDVWVTKPYKSILTNNMCVGGSTYIENLNKDYILCMNVNYDLLVDHMKNNKFHSHASLKLKSN